MNPVEVDSDEDDNSARQTIKPIKLGKKLLNLKTMADLWKLAKNQELMKRGPSQQRSSKRKGELSCRVEKNPATAAIIRKHRIATNAQNKNFVSNTFFDDSSDSGDGSDYMESGLNCVMSVGIFMCECFYCIYPYVCLIQFHSN